MFADALGQLRGGTFVPVMQTADLWQATIVQAKAASQADAQAYPFEAEVCARPTVVIRKYSIQPEIAGTPGTVEMHGTVTRIAPDEQMLPIEESRPVVCGNSIGTAMRPPDSRT